MTTKIIKVGAKEQEPKALKPIELKFFADSDKVKTWLNPKEFEEIYVMPQREKINGSNYDVFFCVGLRGQVDNPSCNCIAYGHLNDGVI